MAKAWVQGASSSAAWPTNRRCSRNSTNFYVETRGETDGNGVGEAVGEEGFPLLRVACESFGVERSVQQRVEGAEDSSDRSELQRGKLGGKQLRIEEVQKARAARHLGQKAVHSLAQRGGLRGGSMRQCGEEIKQRNAEPKATQRREKDGLEVEMRLGGDRKLRHFVVEELQRGHVIARERLQQRVQAFEHVVFGEGCQQRILEDRRVLRNRLRNRGRRLDPLHGVEEGELAGERIAEGEQHSRFVRRGCA